MLKLDPPYYAVIFTYTNSDNQEGYADLSKELNQLVLDEEGFLGVEDYSNETESVAISYWRTKADIHRWQTSKGHLLAKQFAKETWYKNFVTKIALVEKEY